MTISNNFLLKKTIKTQTLAHFSNRIALDGTAKGMYFYNIRSDIGNIIYTSKIIIQK